VPTPWVPAPPGYAVPLSDYNTYELHVDNQNNQEVAIYFLNADTQEGHWTYVLNYAKQIPVIGGGRVRVRNFDNNCRQIRNCGTNPATNATSTPSCGDIANMRILNLAMLGANPAPPSLATPNGILQPQLSAARNATSGGQWMLIDVVSVDGTM
jgi:hypothetical protein